MITYIELRKISLEFRRLSSNLLRSGQDDSNVSLARLMKYIENTPFIHDIIHNTIDKVDFNFKQCFLIEGEDWHEINIPVDEACHIKAQYDYMNFILNEDRSVSDEAIQYPNSGERWSDIIHEFLNNAVKPMIDYINDTISTKMIYLEEEEKKASPSIIQHVGNNYGTLNTQGTGSIISTNTVSIVINDINELLSKIIPTINSISNVPKEDKENVIDDLESIQEQINSPEPKKSRIQKALIGIKKFAGDFIMKLAVTLAVGTVTGADWNLLIEKIEQFLVK